MKLTEENADYMDCRPLLEGEVDMDFVPDHLREALEKQAAAERTAAGKEADGGAAISQL